MCTNTGYAVGGGARASTPYVANNSDEADQFFGKGDPNGMYPQWEAASSQDEKDAITWYTGSSYITLNSKLRNGEEPSGYQKQKVKLMDEAISKFNLENDVQVFRASSAALIGGLTDPDEINATLKGKKVRDKAYLSTAATASGTNGFTNDIEYHINVKAGKGKGVWAKPISQFKVEDEFILKRGTELKVKGARRHPTKHGVTIVDLEC